MTTEDHDEEQPAIDKEGDDGQAELRGNGKRNKRAKFSKLPKEEMSRLAEANDDIIGDDDYEDQAPPPSRTATCKVLTACFSVTLVVVGVTIVGKAVGGNPDVTQLRDITIDGGALASQDKDPLGSSSATVAGHFDPSAHPSPLPPYMPPPSPTPTSPPLPSTPPPRAPPNVPSPLPLPPPPAEIASYVSVLEAPFEEARVACERQGGVLALPTSDDGNTALVDLLTASGKDRIWIGASDSEREGSWARRVRNTFGDAVSYQSEWISYSHWADGQPDGTARENCAEMWTTGYWNDAPCTDRKAFACEVPQPPREDFDFPCSTASVQTQRCSYRIFGADGTRPSSDKADFAACRTKCETQAGGVMAEPRTAEQKQYLARALRQSGDDSVWVALTPAKGGGRNRPWRWLSSNTAIAADETNWAYGQPDNDGDCVEMWWDATWNDRACGGDPYANKVCACEVPA